MAGEERGRGGSAMSKHSPLMSSQLEAVRKASVLRVGYNGKSWSFSEALRS